MRMTLFPSRTLNKRRLFANPRQRCIAPMDFATKRLRHTGEYGTYREAIVRDFFKFIVPQSLEGKGRPFESGLVRH
jgi:hypothetical protein